MAITRACRSQCHRGKPLPPEIWGQILEWATFLPGLMDVDIMDPFDTPHDQMIDNAVDLRQLKLSLATRRALVLVCREWHTLGTPILYRCLLIHRLPVLHALDRTLKASRRAVAHAAECRRPLGWLTRHLVLVRADGRLYGQTDLEALSRIYSCLPQLEIFSCLYPFHIIHYNPDAMRALLTTSGPSLRRMHFHRMNVVEPAPDPSTFASLLASAPHLRTITHGVCNMFHPCLLDEAEARELSFLTLVPEPCSAATCHSHRHSFPSLRQVLFRMDQTCGPWMNPADSWTHFLQMHGHLLRTAYVELDQDYHHLNLMHLMSLMRNHCTELEHLILYSDTWSYLPSLHDLPRVSHLGLRCARRPSSFTPLIYFFLFDFLARISGPSLEVVRILNSRVVEDIRRSVSSGTDIGLSRIGSCNFRLEDHTGQLLLPVA